jgi:CRP/FNR family transcriptional regulator
VAPTSEDTIALLHRVPASRFLAVLKRAAIIRPGRGCLTVHDAAALERYVY